jgi:hypothetical protein
MVSITDNRDLRRSALDRRRVCRLSANVSVGSISTEMGLAVDFRSSPNNGHREIGPVGPLGQSATCAFAFEIKEPANWQPTYLPI